ncbi:MAG: hypothetical protein NDP13_02705 [Crenarchaeota archaeon]|nr:hypothetical protein [Thermoproteota archaeon]MCR8453877.1 hypothetical protein [Thermoproteota archaeon]MCR8455304.1 hypothetical protein [Thermoproteota archaeon]MCR8462574.1 hypothetical protein [Thermoproteota archaeon]MCR8470698.1 hypothetical protein [Thermoproteota archaeon]
MPEKADEKIQKLELIQKEQVKFVELPDVVELYFERADKPGRGITITVPITELFENIVREAAKKLNFKNTQVGVLGGSTPVSFVGKTVKDVIKETSSVNFQIASAEMLGITGST